MVLELGEEKAEMSKARIWEWPLERVEASGSMFSLLPRETRRMEGCEGERRRVRVVWSEFVMLAIRVVFVGEREGMVGS